MGPLVAQHTLRVPRVIVGGWRLGLVCSTALSRRLMRARADAVWWCMVFTYRAMPVNESVC